MARKTAEATVQYLEKSDARVVREHRTAIVERTLDEITKREGSVSAIRLVEEAESEDHPLHKYFEWDDTEAARKYRLIQATAMITATRFVAMLKAETPKKIVVRKLLPSFTDDHEFKPRHEVLGTDASRSAFIERKLSVLRSWCNSVADVAELATVRSAVIELLK